MGRKPLGMSETEGPSDPSGEAGSGMPICLPKEGGGLAMKRLICCLFCLLSPLFIHSQVLDGPYVLDAVKTIEAFLNDIPCQSKYYLISVHAWNPDFHNGYSPESVDYALDRYPYEALDSSAENDRRNRIAISISPDRGRIIVGLLVAGKGYGFYSGLVQGKKGLRIEDVPTELYEAD